MILKCIAGIATPDSGYISLNGRVLFDSEKKINLKASLRKNRLSLSGLCFISYNDGKRKYKYCYEKEKP